MTDYVERIVAHQESGLWREMAEVVFRMAPPVGGRHVLDFGTGAGKFARELADYGALVDAVDANPLMLAEAEARTEPGSAALRYEFAIPYESVYDVAFALHSLPHVEDPDEVVEAIVRHVRTRGAIIVATPNRWHRLVRTPANLLSGYKSDPTIRQRYSVGQLDALMRRHGALPMRHQMCGESYLGIRGLIVAEYMVLR